MLKKILVQILAFIMMVALCIMVLPTTLFACAETEEAATTRPVSWGTNGNENSMGIQADRMKNYVANKDGTVIVAVLDSAFDEDHEFLNGRLLPSINCSTVVSNDAKHGTHTVGTIVDCTPANVKILPVMVNMEGDVETASAVLNGIRAAVNAGAKVINLSLGWELGGKSGEYSEAVTAIEQEITEEIEIARTQGVVVVAAAGNDAQDTETYFPAKLGNQTNFEDSYNVENVITVAAVDEYDLPLYKSVFLSTNYGDEIDVCAPGEDIISSIPIEDDTYGAIDGYAAMSGTSMAAPHVSAAVAMLALEYPDATAAELKAKLKGMTVDLGAPGWDLVYGFGRIDFRKLDITGLDTVAPIGATSFTFMKNTDSDTNATYSLLRIKSNEKTLRIFAHVEPKESTDKSVAITASDTDVVKYENGYIQPISIGFTKLVASKSGLSDKICLIDVDSNVGDNESIVSIQTDARTTINLLTSGDSNLFTFIPDLNGRYVFYSTIAHQITAKLYSSAGVLMATSTLNESGKFVLIYGNFTKGNTYYIKIQDTCGLTASHPLSFDFKTTKDYNNLTFLQNQDARRIQFTLEASESVNQLQVKIGNVTYVLDRKTQIISNQYKVTISTGSAGFSIIWDVELEIPATSVGTSSTARIYMYSGDVLVSTVLKSLIAYGSSYKTNLTPNTTVSTLLSNMATSGYTFTAYTWDDVQITATTTTKVATGTKIVQRNSSGKIVHVYYLVLFGDVGGTGNIGDGLINAADSLEVKKALEQSMTLGVMSELAADVDHDGSITEDDASLILSHTVGNTTINQNYTITSAISDQCYFGTAVAF